MISDRHPQYDVRGWDVVERDAEGKVVRERDGFAQISECLVIVCRKGSATPELTSAISPSAQG